jgi:hypothetical protein
MVLFDEVTDASKIAVASSDPDVLLVGGDGHSKE